MAWSDASPWDKEERFICGHFTSRVLGGRFIYGLFRFDLLLVLLLFIPGTIGGM